jgi:hypothetical protein
MCEYHVWESEKTRDKVAQKSVGACVRRRGLFPDGGGGGGLTINHAELYY